MLTCVVVMRKRDEGTSLVEEEGVDGRPRARSTVATRQAKKLQLVRLLRQRQEEDQDQERARDSTTWTSRLLPSSPFVNLTHHVDSDLKEEEGEHHKIRQMKDALELGVFQRLLPEEGGSMRWQGMTKGDQGWVEVEAVIEGHDLSPMPPVHSHSLLPLPLTVRG